MVVSCAPLNKMLSDYIAPISPIFSRCLRLCVYLTHFHSHLSQRYFRFTGGQNHMSAPSPHRSSRGNYPVAVRRSRFFGRLHWWYQKTGRGGAIGIVHPCAILWRQLQNWAARPINHKEAKERTCFMTPARVTWTIRWLPVKCRPSASRCP